MIDKLFSLVLRTCQGIDRSGALDAQVRNKTLLARFEDHETEITRVEVNGRYGTIKFDDKPDDSVEDRRPVSCCYVEEWEGVPGVKRDLFQRVVESFKPLRLSVFTGLVKISLIAVYFAYTLPLLVALDPSSSAEHILQESRSGIHILSIVVAILVSQLVQNVYRDSSLQMAHAVLHYLFYS